MLKPQHHAAPAPSSPQVWSNPAARCVNLSPPTTGTGLPAYSAANHSSPAPNSPYFAWPQQYVPVDVTVQV